MPSPSLDVAVVIPLYNKEAYIAATLRSVVEQTVQPREVIVIDDGSADRGVEIVKTLAIPNLRIVNTSKPGSGPSAARNLGIASTTCEYIAFLDADDLWSVDYLEKAREALEELPQTDGYFCAWGLVGEQADLEAIPRSLKVQAIDLSLFLEMWLARRDCPLWTSASIFRREAIVRAGCFDEAHRRGEDKDLWLRILAKSCLAYSAEPKAWYRVGIAGQATASVPRDVPPVTFSALKLSEVSRDATIARRLELVSNLTLWHYARINRGKLPLASEYLQLFKARYSPLIFMSLSGIFILSRIRAAVRMAR